MMKQDAVRRLTLHTSTIRNLGTLGVGPMTPLGCSFGSLNGHCQTLAAACNGTGQQQ